MNRPFATLVVVLASTAALPGIAQDAPSAAALEHLVAHCAPVPGSGLYATDVGQPAHIPICALHGAVAWHADLDIDCDGGQSAICRADPAYQPETSATDTHGRPLDASRLPYVVIPLPSARFDYRAAGLQLGSIVAVVYRGRVAYGIFGDEGPRGIIGEASYALATELGIDPHPVTGGVDADVTYIAFTGPTAVVTPKEDRAAAERIGRSAAARALREN